MNIYIFCILFRGPGNKHFFSVDGRRYMQKNIYTSFPYTNQPTPEFPIKTEKHTHTTTTTIPSINNISIYIT